MGLGSRLAPLTHVVGGVPAVSERLSVSPCTAPKQRAWALAHQPTPLIERPARQSRTDGDLSDSYYLSTTSTCDDDARVTLETGPLLLGHILVGDLTIRGLAPWGGARTTFGELSIAWSLGFHSWWVLVSWGPNPLACAEALCHF